jgi:CMP-N-acetylneuraminic acid synthetase
MYHGKRFLAVVPARGGSKGVPRKNLHPLAGKPLLAYTLEQAQQVSELDALVVSTDAPAIAELAQSMGARIVMRPAELSTDTAPTESALLHALDTLAQEGLSFDYVVLLEPTSPLRSSDTIRSCVRAAADAGAGSLVTVSETRANLGRLVSGKFRPLDPAAPRRRQARQPYYVECGTVYVISVAHLRSVGSVVADEWQAVVVSEHEAVDINSLEDFAVAEAILKSRRASS